MRIGWLIAWRSLLLAFGIGFVVGFVGGFLGISKYVYLPAAWITSICIVWPVVVAQMLKHNFRGFALRIIRDDFVSLADLRRSFELENLDPDLYTKELKPLLDGWERKYGEK